MRLSPCMRHADRAGTSLEEVFKQVYSVGCSQRHMSFIVLRYAPWHFANHSELVTRTTVLVDKSFPPHSHVI